LKPCFASPLPCQGDQMSLGDEIAQNVAQCLFCRVCPVFGRV
jgi:hypothetical protein